MIGEDQSVTFFVAAGTTNFNTNTHTETSICSNAVGAPALSPWGCLALAVLLLALGALSLQRADSRQRMQ
jgi:hypothetical protein